MNEIFQTADILRKSPDLFPWVCLAIVLIFIYKGRHEIKDYVKAAINAKKEVTLYHAQHNELVRNNTAALNNNTAALELVQRDREILLQFLEHHEKMSGERFDHLQRVANQTRDIVIDNQKEIIVANERLNS